MSAERADESEGASVATRVRHEQVASVYRNATVTVPITWGAAFVLTALFLYLRVVSFADAAIWFALISAESAARMVVHYLYQRASPPPQDWRRWGAWFVYGSIAGGAAWGFGSLLIMPPGRFDLQLLVLLTISALVYGALSSFGRFLPAFFGFFLPAMVPGFIWSLTQHDAEHLAYSALSALWIPLVGMLAWRYNQSTVRSQTLALENEALAADLARQKARAEAANAAKSRFLAAASHDLRQPVHALGMFVGALKGERVTPNAAKLVDQIEGVAGSLEAMFTGLLDVSKLDAGVVQADVRTFAARPVLRRLTEEMRPAAAAKGLTISLFAPNVWLRSDPLLLERIVRNLMSNAIRYTERGGVLVGVRRAGRALAALEVWDTGAGVADDQRALIFQEFYQTGSAPSRDGGMGLGLAIVRRLADLLGAEITIASKPGRGSMFRVRAPLAAAPMVDLSATPHAEPVRALSLWVIDDDPAVCASTAALLQSWGHTVRTAASSAEMLARSSADGAPDVILCDYGLIGEDGVAAVRALRTALGVETPAALITGETAPDRLREAMASGLPLLHKPLAKARLRALIGNLARAAEDA